MVARTVLYLLIFITIVLSSCRSMYTPYRFAENVANRKEYKEKYRTCEKHNKTLHKSLVRVKYGRGCQENRDRRLPHAYPKVICGGCVVKSHIGVVLKCRKCQYIYNRPHRAEKRDE